MDDYSENELKKICCTCLSNDRKLFQLCRIVNGVNNLYWLLSYDAEAYREGFHKDTVNLFICWECKAIMSRICGFRLQACVAQKQLSFIAECKTDDALKMCLSNLKCILKVTYDHTMKFDESPETATDNFIDCGTLVALSMKVESDLEDLPLSELQSNNISDDYDSANDKTIVEQHNLNTKLDCLTDSSIKSKKGMPKINKNKGAPIRYKNVKENCVTEGSYMKYYTINKMSEIEMVESREKRKMATVYAGAPSKCDSCIIGFKSTIELDKHNIAVHTDGENQTKCDICQIYIQSTSLSGHRSEHYSKLNCRLCNYSSYDNMDIVKHLKMWHAIKKLSAGQNKISILKEPVLKSKRNEIVKNKHTLLGYMCMECNKYFDNKNLRYKHIQKFHREGFKCSTCDKKFPFKHHLSKHEQVHRAPLPRKECEICHKQIRVDLVRVHARIHSERERFACEQCDKQFASRASYEHHLKYTRAHAIRDILKYKCSMCDKGYRSKGELRDHINYQHMGKTQHKCPICGKALATRRCITRHVRRTHKGIKESERDKICQQCGKAFRDKKTLREHEFIHTGERPLSCEICGCTFRQSASLYTHKKRVHKIYPQKKNVELMESETQDGKRVA